jgi:hypothetical protein
MNPPKSFHDLFAQMKHLAVYPPDSKTAKYQCEIETEGTKCSGHDIYALLFADDDGNNLDTFLCAHHFRVLMLPDLPKELAAKVQQS